MAGPTSSLSDVRGPVAALHAPCQQGRRRLGPVRQPRARFRLPCRAVTRDRRRRPRRRRCARRVRVDPQRLIRVLGAVESQRPPSSPPPAGGWFGRVVLKGSSESPVRGGALGRGHRAEREPGSRSTGDPAYRVVPGRECQDPGGSTVTTRDGRACPVACDGELDDLVDDTPRGATRTSRSPRRGLPRRGRTSWAGCRRPGVGRRASWAGGHGRGQ